MKTLLRFSLALVLGLLLVGCGRGTKAPPASAADVAAFDQAKPELKQTWQDALAADKKNDYATAHKLLTSLQTQELSTDQREAVKKVFANLSERLRAALENGDPAAQKALQEIRSTTRAR